MVSYVLTCQVLEVCVQYCSLLLGRYYSWEGTWQSMIRDREMCGFLENLSYLELFLMIIHITWIYGNMSYSCTSFSCCQYWLLGELRILPRALYCSFISLQFLVFEVLFYSRSYAGIGIIRQEREENFFCKTKWRKECRIFRRNTRAWPNLHSNWREIVLILLGTCVSYAHQ